MLGHREHRFNVGLWTQPSFPCPSLAPDFTNKGEVALRALNPKEQPDFRFGLRIAVLSVKTIG
jgi:hypothetical protein